MCFWWKRKAWSRRSEGIEARPAKPVTLASFTATTRGSWSRLRRRVFHRKWNAGRSVDRIRFQALRLHGCEDEQQLAQIPLSKPIMSPTHCRVPDDRLRNFKLKFQAVGKWTESTP